MPPQRLVLSVAVALVLVTPTLAQAPAQPKAKAKAKAAPVKPSADERRAVRAEVDRLSAAIDGLKRSGLTDDRLADVDVYRRAADLMDRLDEYAARGDAAMVVDQVATGLSRVESLKAGATPWARIGGSVVRGYASKVDGSSQPYAVEIPSGFDFDRPARLDVVLHGRSDGINEARFIKSREGKKVPDGRPGLTLHVFGRTNNAYRWAGESDVFEAIESARRNYKVDDDRVVLRGFSMGGAGAWHLGLHHPSVWSSVEAGAGFTETLDYAKINVQTLPDWRKKSLAIYDGVDYALNAFNVPTIGYGGEIDPQLRASTNIVEALKGLGFAMRVDGLVTKAEGLDFVRVVGKGMGHKVDPESQKLLDAFHDERAEAGLDRTPRRVRFVTYTLAYNQAHWISVERLGEHYKRATVDASLDGEVATIATENVAAIGVDRPVAESVRLDGKVLPLRLAAKGLLPKVYYKKSAEGWEVVEHDPSIALIDGLDGAKNPAIHGPIDDAFRSSFLVVIPTGTPAHPVVDAWARGRLDRFAKDWERYLRGSVRTRRDVDLTEADVAEHHLVLFGDPGSNAVLAKVLKGLPVAWSASKLGLAGDYDAATHAPALIAPNPLNPRRYVVVNSGHTFTPADFRGTNALLFPRLGDYAVFKIEAGGEGEVVTSGYFDERWRPRAK